MSPANGAGFRPIRMLEIELAERLPSIGRTASRTGQPYERALALVRLHSVPLGLVDLDLKEGALGATHLAGRIWAELAEAINLHLESEGTRPVGVIGPDALAGLPAPCMAEREAFLLRPPELTVLIPSRERPEPLRRALDSILACHYPPELRRIVVVDNAPETDLTFRLVGSYRAAGETIDYAREDARGSASARNRGLELVDTAIVAMTDDDVVVDRYWLAEIARTFEAFPEAACVTGLLVPAEIETEAQLWFEQYGGFTQGFERRVFDLGDNRVDDPLYPWTAGLFGTGNNFSFRTDVLRDIGGFDPALGNGTPALGGVDSEALLRTILTGNRIVYEPSALVHHAHRPDYEGLKRQVYAYGAGLTAYYLKTLLGDPRLIPDFLRRVPAGLRLMLSGDSSLNAGKQRDFPRELERMERKGMVRGPYLYARSRRRYGHHRIPLRESSR